MEAETNRNKNKFELTVLDPKNLKDIDGFKEMQEQLVKDNPFVKIKDKESYEKAKISWHALRSGRTGLEKQDKTIASVVSKFRKGTAEVISRLIEIATPAEEKQKTEITRWENQEEERKRLKREEEERIEQERVQKIEDHIQKSKNSLGVFIQSLTYEDLKNSDDFYENEVKAARNFDCQEYDFRLEEMLTQKANEYIAKKEQLKKDKQAEEDRAELEQLRAEKQEREQREDERNKIDGIKECYLDMIHQCGTSNGLLTAEKKKFWNIKEVPETIKYEAAYYKEMVKEILLAFHNHEEWAREEVKKEAEEKEQRNKKREEVLIKEGFVKQGDHWKLNNQLVLHLNFMNAPDENDGQYLSFNDLLERVKHNNEIEIQNEERQQRLSSDKKKILAAIDLMRYELEVDGLENAESKDFVLNAGLDMRKLCDNLEEKLKNL